MSFVKRITIELSIANIPYVTRRADGGDSKAKATLFRYFSIKGGRIKGAMTGEAWEMKRRSEETCNSRSAHQED